MRSVRAGGEIGHPPASDMALVTDFPAAQTDLLVRSIGSMPLEEFLEKKDELADALLKQLEKAVKQFDIRSVSLNRKIDQLQTLSEEALQSAREIDLLKIEGLISQQRSILETALRERKLQQ